MIGLDISEVSKITKLKPHTLRYYESIGLIKNIKRNAGGKRLYSQEDLKWLEMVQRLRLTGMNINKMLEYAQLRYIGDSTITQRKKIMEEHLSLIEQKIKELEETKAFVAKKVKIYSEMEEKINGR